MVKNINENGNPILKIKCQKVDQVQQNSLFSVVTEDKNKIWSDEIVSFIADLKETAMAHKEVCAGLSANQIWEDIDKPCPAVFVLRGVDKEGRIIYHEFINPEIRTSGKTVKIEEGCMSFPNYTRIVKREANVTVWYNNLSSADTLCIKIYGKNEFASYVVQHEYDHLRGKTI